MNLDSGSLEFGTGTDRTMGVALADLDGDGDLDLVCGDLTGQNVVYLNEDLVVTGLQCRRQSIVEYGLLFGHRRFAPFDYRHHVDRVL